jgi:hypothetical protein
VPCHDALPKTGELWKNEPHPMCLFAAAGKFLDDLRINLVLSVHEASKVTIAHWWVYLGSRRGGLGRGAMPWEATAATG